MTHNAILILNNGLYFKGYGLGVESSTLGEICFNTSMTGYQEIITDPSYDDQIVCFTFPHIGNVGTNNEDLESGTLYTKGIILRESITEPSNHRSTESFSHWLKQNKLTGIYGIDTRLLTQEVRDNGLTPGLIVYDTKVDFNNESVIAAYHQVIQNWKPFVNNKEKTFTTQPIRQTTSNLSKTVVMIDCGTKQSMFDFLNANGMRVVTVPHTASIETILSHNPDGIFLTNGPADPSDIGRYTTPTLQQLFERKIPIFGVCMGHQLLGIASGGKTGKMKFGHHGSNHPVKNTLLNKVEIVTMNHGFAVLKDSLPNHVEETHYSLFDGSNCGLRFKNLPIFSVQFHPEANSGPNDTRYLFKQFRDLMA